MTINDKVAAAHKINDLLKGLLAQGRFRLKYRITVDPQVTGAQEWERPQILVEFSGPDGTLLLDRGAELLRSMETLAQESLRLHVDEHDRISFDCQGYRAARLEELKSAAQVAAEKVRKTGVPYQFAPMSSRERRIIHLALRAESDLRTESDGAGPARSVVVFPKDFKGSAPPVPMRRSRR